MSQDVTPLPSAFSQLDAIRAMRTDRSLVIFLDYDGTLTPIVPRPEDAVLSNSMRAGLVNLAQRYHVAIVSGRGLKDVREKVALETLYYAGSHGFEIAGPGGLHAVYQPAQAFLADLDLAEQALRDQFLSVSGTQVERKQFAIAVHYRHTAEVEVPTILEGLAAVQHRYPRLQRTGGKKVFELRPDLEWNKGTALFWLLDSMGVERANVFPIYIGDDVTDEDAFLALQQEGLGILVADTPRPTAAQYQLAHTDAVGQFLRALADMEAVPPNS